MTQQRTGKLSTKIILTLTIIIGVLFTALIFVSDGIIKKSSLDETRQNINVFASSFTAEMSGIIDSCFSAMDFYTQSDAVKFSETSKEIGAWLATTPYRRNSYFNYVLFIDADGNSFYDDGKTGFHGDRDYYKEIMYNGAETVVTNPTVAKATGLVSAMIVKAAYNRNNRKVGMFVGVKNMKEFQNLVNAVKYGKNGYAMMIDGTGNVVAFPDSSYQMNKNFLTETIAGHEDIKAVAREMVAQKSGEVYINGFLTDGKELMVYSPIQHTDWSVAISVPQVQIEATATKISTILAFSNIGIAVVIVLILLFSLSGALKPLKSVIKNIDEVSTGNADLTQRIKVSTNDEIGEVAIKFNGFMEKLQEIIGEVKVSKDGLVEIDGKLQDSTKETGASITDILSHIKIIYEQIENQLNSVEETAGAVTEIASNIRSLDNMIENQASGVTQASAAVEEMLGNIASINKSIEKMAVSFTELGEKAMQGSSMQKSVNEQIADIETQSAMLQDANAVISSIASQTNLLAMNAAIEAAHAGDSGKGFAVVADEIRKLSETSSIQSKTIGEQLKKINIAIAEVVESSSKSSAATEMNKGSQVILEEIANLETASKEIEASIKEMNDGATQIEKNGATLAEISGAMDKSISKIGEQIDLFQV